MATTLNGQISALAQQVGADIKQIIANTGDLSQLTTTQKASLVLALNELKAKLDSIDTSSVISDTATATSTTWSSQKISTEIATAVSNLVNGAPDTMDTLNELATAIEENGDAISALETIAAGHVRFDQKQTLEDEQKTQARTNIGAASDTEYQATKTAVGTLSDLTTTEKTNLVGAINEVKTQADKGVSDAAAAQSAATEAQGVASHAKTAAEGAKSTAEAAQTAVSTLSTNIGATDTDFVAIYTAARDGTA